MGLLEKEKLDIVFIEGFHNLIAKRADIPKIITAKDQADLQRTLQGTAEPIIAATGLVSEGAVEPRFGKLPIFNIPKEGQKLLELIRARLEHATP
jgi:molybdopterin-guanine dinucleotide biosynthesis protein